MHKKTHMMRDTDDKLNMRLKKRLLIKDSNGSWFTKRFGIQNIVRVGTRGKRAHKLQSK